MYNYEYYYNDDNKCKEALLDLLINKSNNLNRQNNFRQTHLMQGIYSKIPIEKIKKLIEVSNNINLKDNDGDTAAHYCMMEDKYSDDILNALIKAGADFSIQNKYNPFSSFGQTHLHIAAKNKNEDAVKKLLGTNISNKVKMINVIDGNSRKALYYCKKNGFSESLIKELEKAEAKAE